jgi:PleD family two-component response regulator
VAGLLVEQGGSRVRHEPGIGERTHETVRLRQNDMPHILVVDDDPMVRMAIEINLERHNFQVTVADGGEAGLHALEKASSI